LSLRAPLRSLLVVFFLALGERSARAESRLFVRLDYETEAALTGCPGEAEFRTTIGEQLGYDPFRAGSPYRVVTRTRSSADGIDGTIEWYDESGVERGERELHTERPDCAAFVRTLAFAVAVQIQLLGQELNESPIRSEQAPATKPPEGLKKPAVSARRKEPPPATRVERDAVLRFVAGVGVAAEIGMVPGVVPVGRLFAGLRRGPLGLELGGEASLPGKYVEGTGDGFEHRRMSGVLAGCGFLGLFSACLTGKVGRLRVKGVGIDLPRSPSGTTVELGARFTLNPDLGHLASAVRVELLAPLTSWGVSLNGEEVFRASPVVVALGADIGAFF
jgi:hypothetical protein